jgi:hypothetical protein
MLAGAPLFGGAGAGAGGTSTEGVTEAVPLYDPVKFEPPPPRAPPTTNDLKFSGVPAWSEFWYALAWLSSTGFTPSAVLSVEKLVYTAAPHCQLRLTAAVVEKLALQVTVLIPPGRPLDGTWNPTPSRKSLPDRLEVGRVVSQVLVEESNVVVACVAVGLNVIAAFGTLTVSFTPLPESVIVELVMEIVYGAFGAFPVGVKTPLNQIVLPPAIAVPLKFDVMDERVERTTRSSSRSTAGTQRRAPCPLLHPRSPAKLVLTA